MLNCNRPSLFCEIGYIVGTFIPPHKKNKIRYILTLVASGRAMVQVVSRRPLTLEARIRARVNPCGICGGQSGTGTGFSPSSSVFPCQYIIPPSLSKLTLSGECVIC
jgi:hypothetical protein